MNTKLKFLIGLEKSSALAQLLFLVSAIFLNYLSFSVFECAFFLSRCFYNGFISVEQIK